MSADAKKDTAFRPLASWYDNPPEDNPFGDDCSLWHSWVGMHIENLPAKTSMAMYRNNTTAYVYELRGRPMCPNPGSNDENYSFATRYEIIPHSNSLHLGNAKVHELYRGKGLGGALLGTPIAAGRESGLDVATFQTSGMGNRNWLPYQPDFDWTHMIMGEFGDKLASNVRSSKRLDSALKDELLMGINAEDPELLHFMMESDDLQQTVGSRGRTLGELLIVKSGEWAGRIDFEGPSFTRVFEEIEKRTDEGRQIFMKHRPAPPSPVGRRVRRFG